MSPLRWLLVSAHVQYTDNRPFVDTNRFLQTATMRRFEQSLSRFILLSQDDIARIGRLNMVSAKDV